MNAKDQFKNKIKALMENEAIDEMDYFYFLEAMKEMGEYCKDKLEGYTGIREGAEEVFLKKFGY